MFARQPVRVATGSNDEEGCLLFADDRLVAVLVYLSEQHGDAAGRWFLETGFGPLDGPDHPMFADIDAAQAWVEHRMAYARAGTGY